MAGFCVMEILSRRKTNETIIHFVNFVQEPRAPFTVHLNADRFSGFDSAQMFSPERESRNISRLQPPVGRLLSQCRR